MPCIIRKYDKSYGIEHKEWLHKLYTEYYLKTKQNLILNTGFRLELFLKCLIDQNVYNEFETLFGMDYRVAMLSTLYLNISGINMPKTSLDRWTYPIIVVKIFI